MLALTQSFSFVNGVFYHGSSVSSNNECSPARIPGAGGNEWDFKWAIMICLQLPS